MKILLSAYACDPTAGSESGIGWNFGKELALKGHQVYILTKNPEKEIAFRKEIQELHLQDQLYVIYYDLPRIFQSFYKSATASEHLYYWMWQLGVYFFAKELLKKYEFDVVHHITLGVFRTPSFLFLLDKPFIFGPVGGGEECPSALLKNLPLRFKLKEKARAFLNNLSRFDPFLNQCFKHSTFIFLKTSDNYKYIPQLYHSKCKVELEVGINNIPDVSTRSIQEGKIKILYAGRLIYWKGVHLAIKAYARLAKKHPDVEFTIVGSGPDEEWLKEIARQENVLDKINWIPRVDQAVLFEMYRNYDLLLFPSLHDSSGGVVLEAISFGIPVVCLDLGGPKEIVDSSCSCILDTEGLSESQLVESIAASVCQLIHEPAKIAEMSRNAHQKAKAYSWQKVVAKIYENIESGVLTYQSI